MASIAIVAGNYKDAVPYIEKAVDGAPKYVEAWYDLAQAYYALARHETRPLESVRIMHKGLQAYDKVNALGPQGIVLPPEAKQHLDEMYRSVAAYFAALPQEDTRKLYPADTE